MISAKGLAQHHDFPGLKAFGRIESRRETGDIVQTETRRFALSWMPAPEVFMATVRAHWEIENALHWQLDGKHPVWAAVRRLSRLFDSMAGIPGGVR